MAQETLNIWQVRQCLKMIDFLERKYIEPGEEYLIYVDASAHDGDPYVAPRWLCDIVEWILFKDKATIDEIKKDVEENASAYVRKHLDIDRIYTAACVRKDWDAALKGVEHGHELSVKIGYGFKDNDLSELAKLYKADKHREKIGQLLADCNFHEECSDFEAGMEDRYIQAESAENKEETE